jgi:hypothetical protein
MRGSSTSDERKEVAGSLELFFAGKDADTAFKIYITRDWDQMSQVAADLIEAGIKQKQVLKEESLLGLATGSSPTGCPQACLLYQ